LRCFPASVAADALGKVTGGRGRRAAHLAYQTIPFIDRMALSSPIDCQRQFVSLLPRAKLPIISHPDPTMASLSMLRPRPDSSCTGFRAPSTETRRGPKPIADSC
jgi:hypothetical protein